MKQAEATLDAERQSKENPSVGRKAFFRAVFLASAALGFLTQVEAPIHAQAEARDKINWPAFMRQHDMTFDKLPKVGPKPRISATRWSARCSIRWDDTINLQVFRADVHDHRDDTWGWTAYSRPRLQIGHFSLHPVGKLTGCQWRKDLWNAELTGTITTDRARSRSAISHTRWTWRSSQNLHRAKARKDATGPGIRRRRERRVRGYPTNRAGIANASRSNTARTTQETLEDPWQPNPHRPAGKTRRDFGVDSGPSGRRPICHRMGRTGRRRHAHPHRQHRQQLSRDPCRRRRRRRTWSGS